jgi:hypothetical protein
MPLRFFYLLPVLGCNQYNDSPKISIIYACGGV